MSERLTDVSVMLHHETEKAILVSDDGEKSKAIWLPKSQVEFVHKQRGMIEVTLPEWLATDKGLV